MNLNKQPFYRNRIWAIAYLLALLVLSALLARAWWQQDILQTDLGSLLPSQEISAVQSRAQERINQQMNQNMLIMLGSNDATALNNFAQQTIHQWQHSGLFAHVSGQLSPNLQELQAAIWPLQIATINEKDWQSILADPAQRFSQQAKALVNPFANHGVLPIQEDWLGLSQLILQNAMQDSPVFWNMQTGWLTIEDKGKTWLLLRATLPNQAGLINIPDGLLPLINTTQAAAKQQHIEILMASGAIFAAENKTIGERESQVMSILGIFLTFLLLGALFRTSRILLLLLPLSIGMLAGLATTVLVFGQIHVLTLVVGTSLLGVLLDFPLHWLASGVVQNPWQRWQALHIASKAFLLSLFITLLGYAALLITPLPILQQTALFSAAALIAAFLCSLLWLPAGFKHWQVKPAHWFIALCQRISNSIMWLKPRLRHHKSFWFVIAAFLVLGGWRLNTQDDMRQWVLLSPQWLSQAQHISELTHTAPSGQYFLVLAANDDNLLQQTRALEQQLNRLQQQQQLHSFQSIAQWVVPIAEQHKRRQQLLQLLQQPNNWQVLADMGINNDTIRQYLQQLSQLSPVSIKDSLRSELATAWQPLYLGQVNPTQVAAIVTLSGVKDTNALAALAQKQQNIYFIDQRGQLNTLFSHMRDVAIGLKIASYLLALVLLVWVFNWQRAWKILLVPVVASLFTIAVFGFLGWTLSLFAIFGLFLVTAIGMDYAVYVSVEQMPPAECGVGILLAATTTIISFAILGFSATPAIAGFGRCVAIGVLFNMILALILLPSSNQYQGKKYGAI